MALRRVFVTVLYRNMPVCACVGVIGEAGAEPSLISVFDTEAH